jgi:tight adherence protein B
MSPLFLRLLVLVAIFGSVFIVVQLLLSATMDRRSQKRAVNKRLELLKSGMDRAGVLTLLRSNFAKPYGPDAGFAERTYYHFQRMVRTAGLRINPRQIFVGMIVGFFVLASLLLFLAWSSNFRVSAGIIELACVMALAISAGLPLVVLSQLAQRRRKRMEEQFPLALDIFTRALRAGHPIAAAIDLLTREVEDPLGSEFGLVADEVAYGAELNDALLGLADRWDIEDIRMFVICLSVQSETGGNLAEILENLVKVIRDRSSLFMKVRALSSEGRMSGWMLTALPILTLVSMFMVSPQFYFNVASDPIFIYGYTFLIALYFLGVYIIRRMIDLKV